MAVLTRPGSDHDTLLTMYEAMVKTRMCETVVVRRLAGQDGGYRPVRGLEVVAAGTASALAAGDRLVTTPRCLHELIARGVPLRDVVRMLLAPGSTALVDPSARAHGIIFSAATPGAGIPVAAGAALAAQRTGSARVVVVSFGADATNTGLFHEGTTLAVALQLPLVLLCRTIIDGVGTTRAGRAAAGYGMPGVTIDGGDPVKVRRAVSEAVARARRGGGPAFVECLVHRDAPATDDFDEDPLARYERRLIATGVEPDTLVRISASAMSEVDRIGDVLTQLTGGGHR